ncbi:lipopolysaccharide heptosyltransferase I [Desulfuromonas acetoxidans]|uniref:lipopolysaccharide heptosyltransferase I n=1 Tax=Desulfuromonas acetoxidans TaxID=891 RepID=UPI00292F303E|nr:lipopolysaccharide heptosyltransferase I [Desulfuromonas acetoxidans]
MKILIVKMSALGDVIHALPVLRYIHQLYPDAEIDWVVEDPFAPVLAGHPDLHEILTVRTKYWRTLPTMTMLGKALKFIRRLRRAHYDVVLDLQGNSKSGLFTLVSRADKKFGFDRHQVREWPNLLATNQRIALGAGEHHIAQRALALARAAFPGGDDVPQAGPLHVDEVARQHVVGQLAEYNINHPLVIFHYGTTWDTKLWNVECWQQLASRLLDEFGIAPVLTWGNEQERTAAEAIHNATSGRAVIWPRGTLPELVALLDQADLVVGGDTGPIHMAAAVGTSTVSLFRVTDAERNGPAGEGHRRLQSPLPCAMCLRKQCDEDEQCSRSISVDEVVTAIGELLSMQNRFPLADERENYAGNH